MAQLAGVALKAGFLIPDIPRNSSVRDELGPHRYEGGYVISPNPAGLHENVLVLDFASLYPTIMIAHNLCFTTFVPKKPGSLWEAVPRSDTATSPTGDTFTKDYKGLLPELLKNLLETRRYVRGLAKKESDPGKRKVLDGRQLALKTSANSIYGLTGQHAGACPLIFLARSVTGYGRQMTRSIAKHVEENYVGARVVYGDTDSIMVKPNIPDPTPANLWQWGVDVAATLTKLFVDPIELEMENVFGTFLLLERKKYAALVVNDPDNPFTYCRGIETVRSDKCEWVKKTMSECLDLLLRNQEDLALRRARAALDDIRCGRVNIFDLIITKKLAQTYEKYQKNGFAQAHAYLWRLLMENDPATAPQAGDRVSYVFVAGSEPISRRARDPYDVLVKHNPIDVAYYISVEFAAVIRLFAFTKNADISSSTKVVKPKISKKRGLGKFFKINIQCVLCNAQSKTRLCRQCRQDDGAKKVVMKIADVVAQRERAWQTCAECLPNDAYKSCRNKTCKNLYTRFVAAEAEKQWLKHAKELKIDW